MNSKELEAITSSISEKLGEENKGLIADDLGKLITKNNETLNSIQAKDKEINELRTRNQQLLAVNGNLLQSIPMGIDKEDEDDEAENKDKPFNFKDMFDEKGRLKKKL